MKYIATREGVEKLPKDKQSLPATDNQREFITQVVNRNSYIKTTPEYKYYLKEKTRSAASELIASAVENNPRLLNTEDYLRYMALRPRAERIAGDHGLFSSDDVDLDKAVSDLEKHTGNVYSVIVSLKREDAERLGYNKAERWRDMVRANLADIAKQHNIDFTSLKWYGAFHNESHHPHIHLLLYSDSKNDHSFITKNGLDNLRRVFGTEIFKYDLREIYDRQTDARNKLTAEMRSEFKKLVDNVLAGAVIDQNLLVKLEELACRLNGCKGKKQYGYLPKGMKNLVEELVDDLSKNKTIQRLYDLWYQAKCSVTETYTDKPPDLLPLSKENAFKAIRNALVYEASRLGFELSRSDWKKNHQNNNNKQTEKENSGARHKKYVANAAIRLAYHLGRIFYDNYKKYDPEEDDIDRKLKREIEAVKNGQNIVL